MNFTFTIHTEEQDKISCYSTRPRDASKARERAMKGLQYLGPWCPNCGCKGEQCTGRKAVKCSERRMQKVIRRLEACPSTMNDSLRTVLYEQSTKWTPSC